MLFGLHEEKFAENH